VSTAVDGRDALDQVAERPPEVIVLDVTMPVLDGIGVVRRLRDAGHDLPICILSARDEVTDRVAAAGRCRRLPGQAVRDRRADRAPARAAAPARQHGHDAAARRRRRRRSRLAAS
jgi:two-component system response regulator PrrA